VNKKVEEKGQLWWAGSCIWGYTAFFLLIAVLQIVGFFSWTVYLGAFLLGFLLSMDFGLKWLKNKIPPERVTPITKRFLESETPGIFKSRYESVPKPRVGPRIHEKAVGPLRFALWWVFAWLPTLIGDKLLTGVWLLIARLTGGAAEPQLGPVPASDEPPPGSPTPVRPTPGSPAAAATRGETMEERYGGDFMYRGPSPPTMVGDVPLNQVKKPTDNTF
jgi:hypothetical protein